MLPNSQAEKDDRVEGIKPVAQNHHFAIENGLRRNTEVRFPQNQENRGEKNEGA